MKKILSIFFLLILILELNAQQQQANLHSKDTLLYAKAAEWVKNNNSLRFIENRGQMTDLQGKADTNLLFKVPATGIDIYVTARGLSYVFSNKKKIKTSAPQSSLHDNDDSITEQYCRTDMDLINADIRKEHIIKDVESKDREDYYLGGVCPNGILNIHSYERITIKNVYPGIDWVLYTGTNGLEYDFIVHPGANPSLIKLKYNWANTPEVQNNGSIKVTTPLGNIIEGKPLSYLDNKKNSVGTIYKIANDEISFSITNYDTNKTLTIDPELVWATYYGGFGSSYYEIATAIHSDGTNVWVTGWTNSLNYPTINPGGGSYFQGTCTGAFNAIILQFNTTGTLIWTTYYGGNGTDRAESIHSDGINVWVAGQTTSTNFPTLNPGSGAYFQGALASSNGNTFIIQFNTQGIRKWATYYGGNGGGFNGAIDQTNSIYSDGKNVWVTGYTCSTNFPTLNPGGASYFQGTRTSSNGNAFILQFNTQGIRKWATYYGGNGTSPGFTGGGDIGNSICSDGKNIWVTGYTNSTNFPLLNPGGSTYFQGTYSNLASMAFILQFDTSGIRKWATYYGGNINSAGAGERGSSIYSDGTNVWVTGSVPTTNFPTLNPGGGAYFQDTIGGSYTQNSFILKFTTNGIRKWATYFGGYNVSKSYFAWSIQSDSKNVWVCGTTNSANLFKVNPGCSFFQGTSGNAKTTPQDAFLLQFDTSGICKWSTYYGIDDNNVQSYASSDGTNLFISGSAAYMGYPTLNPGGGAYYLDTLLGDENVFIGKFCISCVTPITIQSPVTICSGDSISLSPKGAPSYLWSPSTGLNSTNSSSSIANPKVTTTYTITGNGIGCVGALPDSVIVNVNPTPTIVSSSAASICSGDSTIIITSGASLYSWKPITGLSSSTVSNPVVKPITSTTYTVTGTIGSCSEKDSVIITVNTTPTVTVSSSASICSGDSTSIVANGANSYTWSPSIGLSSNTLSNPTAKPTSSTTYTVTGTTSSCVGTNSVVVTVNPTPIISISSPATICSEASTSLSASGATSYSWSPTTGLSSNTVSNPNATPLASTTYTVTGTIGSCSEKDSVIITVNTTPTVTVSSSASICSGDSTSIVANGANSYTWSPSIGLSSNTLSNPTAKPTSSTTYTVTGTTSSCVGTNSVVVTVNPTPIILVTPSANICPGDSTILTASGATSYSWSPTTGLNSANIASPIASPIVTITYTVTGSLNGCSGDGEVLINVKSNCDSIFVPNVFTPNGDGKNDVFQITAIGIQIYSIEIFNRWGEKVFESNSLDNPWDGKSISGAIQSDGVYYYVISVEYPNQQPHYQYGFVQLIR